MTRDEIVNKIAEDEEIYERVLMFNAKTICDDDNIKFVLVAGPSCSGKTTTARKLREYMAARGKIVYSVSLDDFYLDAKDCPRLENGKFDFETIYALDLDHIHECFVSLTKGNRTELPLFEFATHSRRKDVVVIEPTNNDIYIVEGLHALNTLIYSNFVDEKHIYRIYLDSFEESGKKKGQTRFLRRLVRDYYYRSAHAERTFDMWDNVASGEDKYIRPFAHLAEGCVNTFFDYETGVLKKSAIKILNELPSDSLYKPQADKVLESLENEAELCPSVVPATSLLQEFIPPRELW